MKKILLIVSILALDALAHAEQPLEIILQKREAVLSELLEAVKAGRKIGRCTDVEVHEALVRLYSFRRDSSKSDADRIKWQKLIVEAEVAAVKDTKSRVAIGMMSPTDELLAQERALAAEQKLAELQLGK